MNSDRKNSVNQSHVLCKVNQALLYGKATRTEKIAETTIFSKGGLSKRQCLLAETLEILTKIDWKK